jgi:Asp-tRNA(Asn)/Glu-tRNA(Gln) amidotransferase A subunit family amidase
MNQCAPQLAQICQPFDAMLGVSCGMLAPVGLQVIGAFRGDAPLLGTAQLIVDALES